MELRGYIVTCLDAEGNVIRTKSLDKHNYPLTKIRNLLNVNLEPLYLGEVSKILIERDES
jgi:hypothetical protein